MSKGKFSGGGGGVGVRYRGVRYRGVRCRG